MASYSYPPLFSCSCRLLPHRRRNTNSNSINHNNHTPSSSTPNSAYHRAAHNWKFVNFSGNLSLVSQCLLVRIKSIWKSKSLKAEAMSKTQGNLSSPRAITKVEDKPEHLLVLVHGILASPSDWTYFEAELKRRLGKKFLIHASSCNTYTKTFTGIDGAGKRLADEVMHIVKKTESLKRISFLAHSLGGLIARYAIAVLYTSNVSYEQTDDTAASPATNLKPLSSNDGLIAGLEAINFITLATPHLGVRGNKQMATPKPPLLLRMTTDCDDGKFISALGTFQRRVLYANVSYDHMVGWRTSSIRRETELVEPPSLSLDGYKHIVNVEYCPPVLSESPHFLLKAAKAKVAAENEPNTQNTAEYHEIMEGIITMLILTPDSVKTDYLESVWGNDSCLFQRK
ncbi:UNVERIFIED_CONTAM: putative lipase ROG1 [Sesamum radiatum]|uniref:Lipase ROG1 n=1 Tax=Sesamum radiatum TaxID=300843 RepID=A0AAW2T454_SESRA